MAGSRRFRVVVAPAVQAAEADGVAAAGGMSGMDSRRGRSKIPAAGVPALAGAMGPGAGLIWLEETA